LSNPSTLCRSRHYCKWVFGATVWSRKKKSPKPKGFRSQKPRIKNMLPTSLLKAVCDPQLCVGEKQETAADSTASDAYFEREAGISTDRKLFLLHDVVPAHFAFWKIAARCR
jgi:hypothetical protein